MLKTIRSRARTATAKEAAERVECQWPAPKGAFPFEGLTVSLRRSPAAELFFRSLLIGGLPRTCSNAVHGWPETGRAPSLPEFVPQLVDFAARQIRQDRGFDYHVTRTRDANLEVLCVCSNVLLPS